MRKHLPNFLLLIFVLTNIFFMALYIRNNGLGLFLRTTGIVLVVLGVIIFIFFLSIDPGYGWIRSIDFTRNYIMIFSSMAVCILGAVFIVTGQHLNELYRTALNMEKRCQQLIAGKATEVLQRDWYSLRDSHALENIHVYLFQKKSDRNDFRIIATVDQERTNNIIRDIVISSQAMPRQIAVDSRDSICPGVYEKDIFIAYEELQNSGGNVRFDLLLTLTGGPILKVSDAGRAKTVRFTLQSWEHTRPEDPGTTRSLQSLMQAPLLTPGTIRNAPDSCPG